MYNPHVSRRSLEGSLLMKDELVLKNIFSVYNKEEDVAAIVSLVIKEVKFMLLWFLVNILRDLFVV